ncbi:hypothetical protein CRG98_050172 [Punica granatum]|uniref:Thaumatin-like protein n=1 Tax=Punica granatum TaxID=22663 RepID=A0A2I0GNS8_PUNGR|nr:hypothetical protein CRG98_050172 [Punica granatum]
MGFLRTVSLATLLVFTLSVGSIDGATLNVKNNCPNTVWAAAAPGGGKRLDRDWPVYMPCWYQRYWVVFCP